MEEKVAKAVAEAPAIAVEKAVEGAKDFTANIANKNPVRKARSFWRMLGPGLTTGAADDDPSGIATYSQTGAGYGFQLIWLALFTFPLMSVVQEMCARIGMVTGRGLAANIRLHYPKWVLYTCATLLFAANSLNIGADLGAMAKATQLIPFFSHYNFFFLVIFFTVVSLGLQIYTSYEKYARYLKWLALILLSYVFSVLSVHINWFEVARHVVVPSITFSKDQILLVAAILGTTISPYLFFWQTSQEVEEEILEGKTTIAQREETTHYDIRKMRVDVWSGMFLSNLVMFFIIAATAATLFSKGITNITSAEDAAAALRPIAGDQAFLLFALGIIGTGLLAVPVLAGSASYAVSESLRWKQGLYRKLREALPFYGVIIIAMVIGLAINFFKLDTIKVLIYSAVANAIVSPLILVLIVLISSDKKIMGERINHPFISLVGWVVALIMALSGYLAILSFFLH